MFKLNVTPGCLSLTSILNSFNRTLDQLEAFIDQNTDRARKLDESIQDMQNERENVVSEIHRAKDVQKNIKSLIGNL